MAGKDYVEILGWIRFMSLDNKQSWERLHEDIVKTGRRKCRHLSYCQQDRSHWEQLMDKDNSSENTIRLVSKNTIRVENRICNLWYIKGKWWNKKEKA